MNIDLGIKVMKADKDKVLRLLKTARGQIEGIIKMIEEDRYCMDIANQLMATGAVLKTANREVLSAHIQSCVQNAKTEEELKAKSDELIKALDKLLK